jgi:hypothetical protein
MGLLGNVREKMRRGIDYALSKRGGQTQEEEKYFDVIYVNMPRNIARGEQFIVEALVTFVLPPEALEVAGPGSVIEIIELAPKTMIEDLFLTSETGLLAVTENPRGIHFVDGNDHMLKVWAVTAKATGEHALKFAWRIDGIDQERTLALHVKFNHRQFLKWGIAAFVPIVAGAIVTAFKPELADLFRAMLAWFQSALSARA